MLLQVKYKEDVSSSLYCSLPQTPQTQRAKELTELQSQVRSVHPLPVQFDTNTSEFTKLFVLQVKYKEGCKEASSPLYHLLPHTAETHLAKQNSELQSEVQKPDALLCFRL